MSQSLIEALPRPRLNVRTGSYLLPIWFAALETWLIRRQGWQDLSRLNDHLLKDIGISREEAHLSARKPLRHRGVHLSFGA